MLYVDYGEKASIPWVKDSNITFDSTQRQRGIEHWSLRRRNVINSKKGGGKECLDK